MSNTKSPRNEGKHFVLQRDWWKKRSGTKSLGLYLGHLRIFFQSFLPPEKASNEREAISRGNKSDLGP